MSCHIFFCASLGLPYHVAATVLTISHINSLRKESETTAPGERPKFLGLIEQRLTGFVVFALIALVIPLRGILEYIPMPVLYGLFLYMGISAVQTSEFYNRCLLVFMPVKYQPDTAFLRHMKTWRVHLFTAIQLVAFIILWVVKEIKPISILFVLMVCPSIHYSVLKLIFSFNLCFLQLVLMVILRKLLDYVFTQDELGWIDDILPAHPLAVYRGPEDPAAKRNDKTEISIENGSVQQPLSNTTTAL